jgi:hypothetical protein
MNDNEKPPRLGVIEIIAFLLAGLGLLLLLYVRPVAAAAGATLLHDQTVPAGVDDLLALPQAS